MLILAFLWFRPQGIFPERRRKLSRALAPEDRSAAVVEAASVGMEAAVEKTVAAVLAAEAAPAPTAGRAPAQLAVRDLRVSFGGVQAVDGLSFDLVPGKATGLIGPNGAGKSTALKLIAGAVPAGRARARGRHGRGRAGPPTRWPGSVSSAPSSTPASSAS